MKKRVCVVLTALLLMAGLGVFAGASINGPAPVGDYFLYRIFFMDDGTPGIIVFDGSYLETVVRSSRAVSPEHCRAYVYDNGAARQVELPRHFQRGVAFSSGGELFSTAARGVSDEATMTYILTQLRLDPDYRPRSPSTFSYLNENAHLVVGGVNVAYVAAVISILAVFVFIVVLPAAAVTAAIVLIKRNARKRTSNI